MADLELIKEIIRHDFSARDGRFWLDGIDEFRSSGTEVIEFLFFMKAYLNNRWQAYSMLN